MSDSQQTEMSRLPELFVQLPTPPTEIGDGSLATAAHPGGSILSLLHQLSPHGLHQEQQDVLSPGTTVSQWLYFNLHENVHQVGSILIEKKLIITQLAMFDVLLRFDHHWWPSSGSEEGRRWWSKCRSKSNIASCVIMTFVSNTFSPLL